MTTPKLPSKGGSYIVTDKGDLKRTAQTKQPEPAPKAEPKPSKTTRKAD